MKIVRIIARLNVGGPARHVVWLSDGLSNAYQTVLVTGRVPEGEEDMGYLAAEYGVEPVFIEEMSRELSPKDAISLVKIFRLLLREKPEIVSTHTAKAGTVGRAAAFLYKWLTPGTLIGRPRELLVTHTFHGHVFHSYYSPAKTRVFILIEKALARFATDRIIVISPQQFKEIHEDVGIGRREQFDIVPLGIDLAPFTRGTDAGRGFREELGVAGNEILVSFVGRLTEIKNVPLLLRAAAKVRERTNADETPAIKIAIVGDGHLRSTLEQEAHELGADNVIFAGNRKDVPAIYAASDIVVLTSLNEGTPLSLIEAMAAGRPVIATVVGGVRDLLGEPRQTIGSFQVFERGLGVESGDAEALAEGLLYLSKNENLRSELAAQGRDFISSRYGVERLVADISPHRDGMKRARPGPPDARQR